MGNAMRALVPITLILLGFAPPIVSLATETGQIVVDSKDREIIVDDGILSVVDLTPSDFIRFSLILIIN